MFFRSSEFKMVLLYAATSVCIYLGFWLGWYFLPYGASLGISAGLCLASGLAFALVRDRCAPAIVGTFVISVSIGLAMSALFVALGVRPSRFLGLVLLIMLAYKGLQALWAWVLPSKKLANAMLIIFTVAEVAACIAVGVKSAVNPPVMWQIFCALMVCVFYSFGLMTMKSSGESTFWRTAARCYIIGFVVIFIAVAVAIISFFSEDSSGFEFLGEFASGADVTKKKQKILPPEILPPL